MSVIPRILIEHVWPPIPDRRFDYLAYYDGEQDEQFDHGWGRTEAEAVVDLIENHPRGVQCELWLHEELRTRRQAEDLLTGGGSR